jgi:hypothetical protein
MVTTIIYDNHTPDWADLAPRLTDFTKFRLNSVYSVVTKDIHQALLDCSANCQWAVVFATGNVVHKIHNPSIVDDIVAYCKQENSPLAGHILHKNGYYQLHPQFFCIDLTLYRQWAQGLEPLHHVRSILSVTVERSLDNVHDDYTPWWIKPSNNQVSTINCRDAFASRFIAWLLNHGHRIVNVPHNIRQHKIYSYADYNHEDIRKFIKDTSYTTGQLGVNQFLNYVKNTLDSLIFGFYPINTEPVTPVPGTIKNLNVFAGVCGGIKPAIITSQPCFSSDTKVILFDISEMAIEWQRWLREHWNGGRDTIELVFNKFMQTYPAARAQYYDYMGIVGNFDWVLKHTCTEQEFKHKWANWKTLEVEYVRLDLLESADQQKLIDKLEKTAPSSYIWTSNLFFMDWQIIMHEPEHVISCQDQFIELIKKSQHSVVLENQNKITVY